MVADEAPLEAMGADEPIGRRIRKITLKRFQVSCSFVDCVASSKIRQLVVELDYLHQCVAGFPQFPSPLREKAG